MKKFKKITAIILAVLTLSSVCAFSVSAEELPSGTFKALCYNVAGLPKFDMFSGKVTAKKIWSFLDNPAIANQKCIGKYVNSGDYDIFATQENFFYDYFLEKELTNYNYSTQWRGGVPWGDGTSIFTKNYKMTGEEHIMWNSLSGNGTEDDGADIYSRKGITYACIEIGNGVYIDFYNIHADAFGDEKSVVARKDNFKQLADLIDSKNTGRPVIITGDFNISSHHTGDASGVYFTNRLIKEEGFKDAWTELYNNGNYDDYSEWGQKLGYGYNDYWGKWDSVEKFLYRSGNTIELKCDSFEYFFDILNSDGERCSDHASASASFTYTVKGVTTGEKPSKKENIFERFYRKYISFFFSLFTGLISIDRILKYVGIK